MTIKKRIVVWYTLWMGLLAILLMAAVVSASDILVRREAMEDLAEEVDDAMEDAWMYDGRLVIDDIDFYDDGIYIQIFDRDGNLLAGMDDDDFPPLTYDLGTVTDDGRWLVLVNENRDGLVVRGLMRTYGMGSYIGSVQILSLILLPVVIALAALGGYFIVRRSFLPADRAIEAADRIIDSNDLSRRIALGEGNDEIHRMASAFDSMLDRLEEAFQKEKQFTSDASHELRTPLSVIKAECEYALSHSDDSGRMEEALRQIDRQGDRMMALVGALLAIARADRGTLAPKYESFDLVELVRVVSSSLEDKAGEKSITISSKMPDSLVVTSDQGMIARVLVNYMSNAIQYTDEGGWVLVRLRDRGDMVEIAVDDNGIGIAEYNQARIWDRFYQVDPSRSASSSGAGLGLAMVKGMADALSGSVSVESAPGQGSVFTFTFPKNPRKDTE